MTTTVTETAKVPMTLSEAQRTVSDALKEADRVAALYRQRVLSLSDEVSTLEKVLAMKQTELARAREETGVCVALLREHFSLYRDVMGLSASNG